MNTRKVKLIFLCFCFICTNKGFSQEKNDFLTEQQLIEEYDYFVGLIAEVNPHLAIYKKLMHYDMVKELKTYKKELKHINNWPDYYLFLSRMLQRIPEAHTKVLLRFDDYDIKRYPNLFDSLTYKNVEKIFNDHQHFMEINSCMEQWNKYPSLNIAYINGDLYSVHDVRITNETYNKVVEIPLYSKITKVNGIAINDFLKKNQFNYHYPFDAFKWDSKLKSIYPDSYRWLQNNSLFNIDFIKRTVNKKDVFITFLNSKNEEETVKYISSDNNEKIKIYFHAFEKPEWSYLDTLKGEQDKVLYFDNILYIKLTSMANNLDFFRDEMANLRNAKIDKIVIDVRNNRGGSDNTWSDLLSLIIDTTFCRSGKLAITDCQFYRNNPYLLYPHIDSATIDNLEAYYDPMLKKKYRLLSNGTDCMEIKNASVSLNFRGKIYLLHNRNSYSSASAFVTFALGNERIITVGESNGYLGGYGTDPFIFQLPYSKFIFIMHSTIHIPDNIVSIDDYFWNKTEIEIKTTPEFEVLRYLKKDFYTPEFLKTKDPFFKKVIELP